MPRRSKETEDEAYAAALQEEYRKEFLRRQAKKNKYNKQQMMASASAPTSVDGVAAAAAESAPVPNPSSLSNRTQRTSTTRGGTARSSSSSASSAARRDQLLMTASAPPEDLLWSGSPPPVTTTTTAIPPVRGRYIEPPPDIVRTTRSPTIDSDEQYARQVYLELEQEEQQRRSYNSNNINNITSNRNVAETDGRRDRRSGRPAPPLVVLDYESDDLRIARELQDEEYARRLERMEALQRASLSARPSVPGGLPVGVVVPPSSSSSSRQSSFMDERVSSTLSDEAAARRIAQEMEDAALAQRMAQYEEEAATRRRLEQQQQEQEDDLRRGTTQSRARRIVPIILCATAIAVIPVLYVTGVFDPSNGSGLGGLFDNDWIGNDPWAGNTTGTGPTVGADSYSWANTGNGLSLEILNAASDQWQVFLAEAITNWDNGYPIDSLTLTTTRVAYESACTAVDGVMKACNGDYGDTKWRGLNEVMLSSRQNTIVSSTARFNEYYLSQESDAQRLYTACHELGHGFGLPHWDEDFFNKDLGNCMDYTQNPELNSKPDESNFMYLAELYGGRNVTESSSSLSTSSGSGSSSAASETQSAVPPPPAPGGGGGARHSYLRRTLALLGGGQQDPPKDQQPQEDQQPQRWKRWEDLQPVDKESRVIEHNPQENDDTTGTRRQQRRRRVLVHANDFQEVHVLLPVVDKERGDKNNKNDAMDDGNDEIVKEGQDDYIIVQHYLLA